MCSTDERSACLKKFVKEDLTQFFKLNQLLNRVQACILYFVFCIYSATQKNFMIRITIFKDELTITATDTIIIKGNKSNNIL